MPPHPGPGGAARDTGERRPAEGWRIDSRTAKQESRTRTQEPQDRRTGRGTLAYDGECEIATLSWRRHAVAFNRPETAYKPSGAHGSAMWARARVASQHCLKD